MSTSSKPALQHATTPQVRPFPYAEAAAENNTGGTSGNSGDESGGPAAEQLALEKGRQEGEARAQAAFQQELLRQHDMLAQALRSFARERTEYYRQVEVEVVQLALSIARKILHREAQLDPLLLAGMVRVALEKVERGSKVIVRVHPQQAGEWRGYFARCLDPHELPEVDEDPALEGNRCVLQTALGTTQLGLEVQLKEIEQGLLDVLAQRPKAGT